MILLDHVVYLDFSPVLLEHQLVRFVKGGNMGSRLMEFGKSLYFIPIG